VIQQLTPDQRKRSSSRLTGHADQGSAAPTERRRFRWLHSWRREFEAPERDEAIARRERFENAHGGLPADAEEERCNETVDMGAAACQTRDRNHSRSPARPPGRRDVAYVEPRASPAAWSLRLRPEYVAAVCEIWYPIGTRPPKQGPLSRRVRASRWLRSLNAKASRVRGFPCRRRWRCHRHRRRKAGAGFEPATFGL
jgi:hypothetical protein